MYEDIFLWIDAFHTNFAKLFTFENKSSYTSIRKICNFTGNRDHINKSKETRVVAYICRYSSEPLIPNPATGTG